MRDKYTEDKISDILKLADSGIPVKEICRKYKISDSTFYNWRRKTNALETVDKHRLKQLENENAKLRRLLARLMLDADDLKSVFH